AFAHDAAQALRTAGAGQHAQVNLRQADLAGVAAGNADVGSHGDFQTAAYAVAVDRCDHQFGGVLQTQQRLVGMETEVILESRIHRGEHLDVGAVGEAFFARGRPQQDQDV